MQEITKVPLLDDLRQRDVRLFARALDVRDTAARWLTYIPAVFPHYTQHTVEHSDAVLRQLSHMLYANNSAETPALLLSPIEVYILVVSAYLHDTGMVASTREQVELMRSDDWHAFVEEGTPGHERMVAIEKLRRTARPNATEAAFLADVQLRFLLAEFIRRTHHQRSGVFLTDHAVALAQFDLGDPLVLRSIRAACVGHGLRPTDLNDQDEYPERRTVQGDQVNVRLLAGLLRVGDLLDMSTDRACPLLLSAASPLPADSYAHWTQYRRVTHQLVAPDRIEISAECENRDEHSFLSDWCTWLADEVEHLSLSMLRAKRHGGWAPPHTTITGDAPTIRIGPSAAADYVPVRWRVELDSDHVLDRLIHDAYGSRETAFLRELLQNAADTNRCRMIADLEARGAELPPSPHLAPPDVLATYPIRIAVSQRDVKNDLSGETESRSVVTVEDTGMGMTEEVITSFLLQVGRSFYQTPAFRRRFSFEPASRFGIGFLSVFGISDHVEIDTFSAEDSSALHLALPGPRAIVLAQRGGRTTPGTAISVVLRPGLDREAMIAEVRRLRGRLEFPVLLDTGDAPVELPREADDDFVVDAPDVTERGARFRVAAFPMESGPLSGSLYVFAHEQRGITSWTRGDWAGMEYPALSPGARAPGMPADALFLHGLYAGRLDTGLGGQTFSSFGAAIPTHAARIDVRGPLPGVTLDRNATHVVVAEVTKRLQPRWEELLLGHAAEARATRGDDAWQYLQELMDAFPFVDHAFWRSLEGSIRYWRSGWHSACINDLVDMRIAVPLGRTNGKPIKAELRGGVPVVQVFDGLREAFARIFLMRNRTVLELGRCGDHAVAVLSASSPDLDTLRSHLRGTAHFVEMPDSSVAAWVLPFPHTSGFSSAVLFNTASEFGTWLQSANQATVAAPDHDLLKKSVETVIELASGVVHGIRDDALPTLETFLREWRRSSDLPSDCCPPEFQLSQASFSPSEPDRVLSELDAQRESDPP
jgi:hypothetical protein